MVERDRHEANIIGLLDQFPIVGLLGARQVGKTTLARRLVVSRKELANTYFDLEDPRDLARLSDPMLALDRSAQFVVIDEIQRLPELFPILRVLADRSHNRKFLLLGSASPDLLRQSSESLAGRIAYYELPGFALDEVGSPALDELWVRGGFPRAFLAESDRHSAEWRSQFIRTFLERDLPQLGVTVSSTTMKRFWTMLAHSHGQIWNASAFGRSFGVADTTVRRYLDILSAALVVRQLPPWQENLKKRQVKSPKVYLSDSGLLHSLLGIETLDDLMAHPKLGASWEGVCLEMAIQRLGARPEECFFWATYTGAELDLFVHRGRRRFGFEFKRTVAPRLSRSLRIAIEDLNLDAAFVVHAGAECFPLTDRVQALSASHIWTDLGVL